MGQINQAVKLDKVIKKFNIKNFIETGTGLGESLEYLLKLDESKDLDIHSIELMEQLYNILQKKFKSVENLDLIKGYSHEEIGKLMEGIADQPTIFWHDAHFPGADFHKCTYEESIREHRQDAFPLEEEVNIIMNNRNTSKDVFIIDDLILYEKDAKVDCINEGIVWKYDWLQDELDLQTSSKFLYDKFEKTHDFTKDYRDQGYLIITPKVK